ncbi:MAG: F0F1 ATP synthase subunit B [Opitutaceae bacterium]|nr:F0F1 ATP synthase subunit B [Opitutaceae bacterium]
MLTAHLFLAAASASTHSSSPEGGVEKIIREFGIDTPYIIAQIISFCVVAFLLYKFFFKPVLATIDERQTTIESGLQYAKEMKTKLEEAEKETTEVIKKASLEAQQIIVEARDSGKALLEKQAQEATSKAQDIITKAEHAIELERKKMMADVRDEISRLVVLTTSRVLSKELPEEDKQKYAA